MDNDPNREAQDPAPTQAHEPTPPAADRRIVGLRFFWRLYWQAARLHIQRKMRWQELPGSMPLAWAAFAIICLTLDAVLLRLGAGPSEPLVFTAVWLAGFLRVLSLIRDPRWAVAYTWSILSAGGMGLALAPLSATLGEAFLLLAIVTSFRLLYVMFEKGGSRDQHPPRNPR